MEKITADNFITDDKTNKVYISSLIDRPYGDLDKGVRSELKDCIMHFDEGCELLVNTMDVWARDYMPIQLTEDIFLGYTYNPDYLANEPKCITNWQLHHVHTQKEIDPNECFDFNVVQMPIILDGGNVVKAVVNNKPCMIMCDKVLDENHVNEEDFSDWWTRWWERNFNGTEMGLVLLPWDRKTDPIGHADGIVRYIQEGRVLMTNYLDFDEKYNGDYGNSYIEKLTNAGFNVETLSYLDKLNYEGDKTFRLLFNHSWCYINYLQVGNRILVPSLGYDTLDQAAMRQIDHAFNAKRRIVEIQLIDVDMTTIVEDMNSKRNSGGGLNCLTWTIYDKTKDPDNKIQ